VHLRVEDPFSPLKQKLEKLAVRLAVSKWRQKVEAYKLNKLEQDERGLEHGVRKSEKEPRTGIHVV